MARFETSHPINVSATNEYVPSCGREDCHKWGIGVLRIAQMSAYHRSATLILADAGCEICPGPHVTTADTGVIGDFTQDIPAGDETTKEIKIRAEGRLGQAVDALPMQNDESL
jgi:hypothetical protein